MCDLLALVCLADIIMQTNLSGSSGSLLWVHCISALPRVNGAPLHWCYTADEWRPSQRLPVLPEAE